MTIAYDAVGGVNDTTGTTHTWTHTPSGTPRGIIVASVCRDSTHTTTGVTYNGVSMTLIDEIDGGGGISGNVSLWFLGSSIPTGAQTVVATTSADAIMAASSISVTAAADTAVQTSGKYAGTTTSATTSLSLSGVTCFCCVGIFSGRNSGAGIIPLSGWSETWEEDLGVEAAGFHTYDTVGSTDVTAGFTQTSDVAAIVAAAIREESASTAIPVFTSHYQRMRNR